MEGAQKLYEEACEVEGAKNYEKALSLFQQGLKHCMEFINYYADNDEQKRDARKLGWLLANRGEAVKTFLQRGGKLPKDISREKQPSKSGSGSKVDNADQGLLNSILNTIYKQAVDAPRLSDVIGLEIVKSALNDWAIIPMALPSHAGNSWKGILLFGPTGTGKTHIGRAVANQCNSVMFYISSSSLASKWHGEAEKLIKILFDAACTRKPSIIFMDEVEWLCSTRSREGSVSEVGSRMKSELLVQMSKPENRGILVLAATNQPESLDPAFLRRFSCRVYVKLPDSKAREELIQKYLSIKPHTLGHAEIKELAEQIDGYSGADIQVALEEAQRIPVRKLFNAEYFREIKEGFFTPCTKEESDARQMRYNAVPDHQLVAPPVTARDVKESMRAVSATVTAVQLAAFEKFNTEHGYKLKFQAQ